MRKNALIRFSLTLAVIIFAVADAFSQEPAVPARTPAATAVTMPSTPVPSQEQLASYYEYPYGSRTTKTRTLSAEEAVKLALENAASLRQAQFDEQSAGEDVKLSRAATLPQFNLPLTYWGTTPSTVRQPGEPLVQSFVASSAVNESIGWLTTTGTLDVSGKLRAELNRSHALLAAAHAGTMTARRNLVLATIDAYYGLAMAGQRRRLADEALALAEGFLSSLEEQQKTGVAAD